MAGTNPTVNDLMPLARGEAGAATESDRYFMRQALSLAERGWGRVHPNPLVGAVVVKGGEVVGAGYHAEFGGPHAEVAALADAGELARGATLYVTLEPCAHHGKTPPCTAAIIEAGIARVVYAVADPHKVASGGAERLRQAGIEVVAGVEEAAARTQNAIFLHNVTHPYPYLALKLALTLDAKLSESPDRPSIVTGPEARAETQRLRAGYDAIMVGSGTALADDPLLTVRGSVVPIRPPARIVVDTEARLSPTARLLGTIESAPVTVICAEDSPPERRTALEDRGARILTAPRGPGGIELQSAVEQLGRDGIRSIFCEGGGRLGAALLRADLVQRLYLFYAPRFFGSEAVAAFPGHLDPGQGWRRVSLETFGPDLLVVLDRDR